MLELLLSLAILGLFLGMLELKSPPSASRAAPLSLAEVLAQELRSARMVATSSGRTVGVGFPSREGTLGPCQAYYRLEGEAAPRLVGLCNTVSEFPGATILPGIIAGSKVASEPPWDSVWARHLPFPRDAVLIFHPDGQVTSSQLSRCDGAYRVLVGSNLECAPSTQGWEVSSASQSWWVVVQPSGAIEVVQGPANSGHHSGGAVAAAPSPLSVSNRAPSLKSLSPAQTLAHPGQPLSLEVRAVDEDPGDQLSCRWWTEPGNSGQFSDPNSQIPLRFDRDLQLWVGRCSWLPPSQPQKVVLHCQVTDRRGEVAIASAQTQIGVQVEDLCWLSVVDNQGQLLTVNFDGSRKKYLDTRGCQLLDHPVPSPDGSHLAFLAVTPESDGRSRVCSCNLDGGDFKEYATPLSGDSYGYGMFAWTQDSAALILPTESGLGRLSLDRESLQFIPGLPADGSSGVPDIPSGPASPSCSPTGQQLAYLKRDGTLAIYQVRARSEFLLRNGPGLQNFQYPLAWKPDGSRLAVTSLDQQGRAVLQTMKADGSDLKQVFVYGRGSSGPTSPGTVGTMESNQLNAPSWSWDGSCLAVCAQGGDAPGVYLVQDGIAPECCLPGNWSALAWFSGRRLAALGAPNSIQLPGQTGGNAGAGSPLVSLEIGQKPKTLLNVREGANLYCIRPGRQ
ncbi:MAG: hypothetical protein U0931_41575 [Vulcanimicrobiota bacterium]